MSSAVEIVPFRAEHGAAFYALNRAWLDEHGLYEPPDEVPLPILRDHHRRRRCDIHRCTRR